jgi:hypothetical protein
MGAQGTGGASGATGYFEEVVGSCLLKKRGEMRSARNERIYAKWHMRPPVVWMYKVRTKVEA